MKIAQPTNRGSVTAARLLRSGAALAWLVWAIVQCLVLTSVYGQAPSFEWARQEGGTNYDVAERVAVDGAGNCYVTGRFVATTRFAGTNIVVSPCCANHFFVAKYDNAGALLWVRYSSGTVNSSAQGNGIAVDPQGNCYVTGAFQNTVSFGGTNISVSGEECCDAFVAKYDSNGSLQWVSQIRGGKYESGEGIAVDDSGNCYLTGAFTGTFAVGTTNFTALGPIDTFFLKYDASGAVQWARQLEDVNNGSAAITIDRGRNLYLAGRIGNGRFFLAKYSSAGVSQWVQEGVSVGSQFSGYQNGVAVDAQTNVFVCGQVRGTVRFGTNLLRADVFAPFIVKYSMAGHVLWANVGGGEQAVAVDSFGNAYVTARDYSLGPLITKFDPAGQVKWTVNGPSGRGIAVNSSNELFITGTFQCGADFGVTNLSGTGNCDLFSDLFIAKLPVGELIAPVITVQPTNQTVISGTSTSFGVTASGTGPLNYQWRFNGTNITNATSSLHTIPNVQLAHAGNYNVVIRNSAGAVTSAVVTLSVLKSPAPSIFVDGEPITNGMVRRTNAAVISMTTSLTNGSIFFTIDGSVPSFATSLYQGSFPAYRSLTIRAIAYDANFVNSWEADAVSISVEPTYSVSATAAGGGSVSRSPASGAYSNQALVTLTATPVPGWTFLQWLGDASGANPTNTVRVTGRDLCVQALFGTSLGTTVAGNGSVLVDPVAPLYPYGTVVRLTGLPQAGNFFAAWGNAASSTNNPLLFAVTNANPTVSCAFGSLGAGEVALTVVVNGQGRVTANPRGSRFNTNQSVTLTAVPDADQSFAGWSGDASGAATNLVVAMNQSRIINANFTVNPRLSVGPCRGGLREDGFQFTLTGSIGARYQIDTATSLVNWAPLAVVTNSFGMAQFTDVSATNGTQRFYRLRLAP